MRRLATGSCLLLVILLVFTVVFRPPRASADAGWTSTFTESGLPVGVTWGVTLSCSDPNCEHYSAAAPASITVRVSDGVYSADYTYDSPVDGYICETGCSGTVSPDSFPPNANYSPLSVGGALMPANTLALLSPWLAVIGLVGCISTVALVTKKRRQ
jgi:hypothetical protein